MTLNLVPTEGLVTRYTHVKYEGRKSYQSKDMANVKVFADKQMDTLTNVWAKNYMPLIYRCRGIKIVNESKFKAFADGKINVTKQLNSFFFGKSRKQCGKRRKCCLPESIFLQDR